MSHAKVALGWADALKTDLSRPLPRKMIGRFLQEHLTRIPGAQIREGVGGRGEVYAERMSQALEIGEVFFLDREMLPLVVWAGRSLDDDDALDADLWPASAGFVLLDEPLIHVDARGRQSVTKALLWHPLSYLTGQPGMAVTYLTDASDPRDETSSFIIAESGITVNSLLDMGRLQINHIDFIRYGDPVGPQAFDTSGMEFDPYGFPPLPTTENTRRFILSFLLMLNQTVTATSREQVSPKHAARMSKRRLPSMVTVVHMRRIAGVNRAEGESHVEWARRWIVRGHWRNQPCKVDGEWTHRRIWIAPFVKGPEDAPLIVPRKVYSLDR